MSTMHTVAEQWAMIVQFYEEIHPAHRQTPMTALVFAVAEAGITNGVWPSHSQHCGINFGKCVKWGSKQFNN